MPEVGSLFLTCFPLSTRIDASLDYAWSAIAPYNSKQKAWNTIASLYYAVGDRLRPIFMSAGTSVLGMLPLAILPGKGAELYQGLGIAKRCGLALSTFLTPTVIPALMGLRRDFKPKRSMKKQEFQKEESMKLVKDKS